MWKKESGLVFYFGVCFRCLDECRYDLKEALKLFVDLYKNDKIPEEAFEVK